MKQNKYDFKKRVNKLKRISVRGIEIPNDAPDDAEQKTAEFNAYAEQALGIDFLDDVNSQLEKIYNKRDEIRLEKQQTLIELDAYLTDAENKRVTVSQLSRFVQSTMKTIEEYDADLSWLWRKSIAVCKWRAIRNYRRQIDKVDQAEGAASVTRNGLVFPPASLPGEIGEALQLLTPDERQIFNLRMEKDIKRKTNSWAKVATKFKARGKSEKTYTRERCRQIYNAIISKHPILKKFSSSEIKSNIKKADEINEMDEIKTITTQNCYDNELSNITNNPRKPAYLANRNR